LFTKKCQALMEEEFGAKKVLLTNSCTAALEMAAILCEVGPGDEVILPSFTFVSTANAFYLRGAKLVFVDIRPDTLNMDETKIERAITEHTRVIIPVHYAGVACEMNAIMGLAQRHNLYVVEDAAQGVNAKYNNHINLEVKIKRMLADCSDHFCLWQNGYDAIFYFESEMNPDYHTPQDGLDTVNITYATKIARQSLATIAELSQITNPIIGKTLFVGGLGPNSFSTITE